MAPRIERSFVGAILCVITVILILFTFNNNEWVTVLSDHPQISPPWWWDNHKMRARKNIADNRLKTFATWRSCKQLVWRRYTRSNWTNQRPWRITIVVQLNRVSWSEFYVGATYHDLNHKNSDMKPHDGCTKHHTQCSNMLGALKPCFIEAWLHLNL